MLFHELVTGPAQLCLRALGRIGEPCAANARVTLYSTTHMGAEESIHAMSNQMGESKAEFSHCTQLPRFLLIKSKIG